MRGGWGWGLLLGLMGCGGPTRAERRAAEVEVCRGEVACLVADRGWSVPSADSAALQWQIAELKFARERSERMAAEERKRDSIASAELAAVRAAELKAAQDAVARRRAEAVALEKKLVLDARRDSERRAREQAEYYAAQQRREQAIDDCLRRNGWAHPESKERPVTGRVHGRLVALPLMVHVDTFAGITKACSPGQ